MSYDPGISGISGAADVFLNNPADSEALSYNDSTAKWENSLVDKARVGLANVDNTADTDKPVSTATQTALNLKVDSSALAAVATSGSYVDLSSQPSIPSATSDLTNDSSFITVAGAPVQSVAGQTGVVTLTKSDVGLANVDNTADVDKPVSTLQQAALDTKQPQGGVVATVGDIPAGAAVGTLWVVTG